MLDSRVLLPGGCGENWKALQKSTCLTHLHFQNSFTTSAWTCSPTWVSKSGLHCWWVQSLSQPMPLCIQSSSCPTSRAFLIGSISVFCMSWWFSPDPFMKGLILIPSSLFRHLFQTVGILGWWETCHFFGRQNQFSLAIVLKQDSPCPLLGTQKCLPAPSPTLNGIMQYLYTG